MTTDDIERMARDRKPLPTPAKLHEQCYYWTMSGIWSELRGKRMDAHAAAEAKRSALRAFAEFSAAYEVYCAYYRKQQEAIRKIKTARTDILRAETTDEKLRLALEALAAATGDETICRKID